jgi:hypothetical protein
LRLIQAKVLSTTHLFGKTTNPLAMSDRLTISIFQVPVFAVAARTRPLIAAIGVDTLDKWKQPPCSLVEHQRCAIAILDIGRMNDDA